MSTTIQLGNIVVDVVLKDIKNIHLSVYPPTGKVRISAPARMNVDTIRLFAISKLGWIKQQQRKLVEQEREAPREFIDREIYVAHFGFPMVPLIPIVTVSEARMRNMMTLLTEICGGSTTKYFLFRAIPAFASFEQSIPVIDDLLMAPWQRVGAQPLRLSEALKRP